MIKIKAHMTKKIEEILDLKNEDKNNKTKNTKAIFGKLSCLCPVTILIILIGAFTGIIKFRGFGAGLMLGLVLLVLIFAGFILGIVALVRNEKPKIYTYIGFFVNVVLVIFALLTTRL